MCATVKVWDPFVRIFHGSLVASFIVAWLTADELKDMHEFAGYLAGTLVASRLIWGILGSRYAGVFAVQARRLTMRAMSWAAGKPDMWATILSEPS